MSADVPVRSDDADDNPVSEPIKAVLEALGTLRFGGIQLTVHDGKLVQVDITERRRFTS
jgi:hypothetical protein